VVEQDTAVNPDCLASNPAAPTALAEASGHCIGAIPSRLLVLLSYSEGPGLAK